MTGERPFYLYGSYQPVQDNRTDWIQPMAEWRHPGSTERQRAEFNRIARDLALMAWTWPVAPIAWPIIWMGGMR